VASPKVEVLSAKNMSNLIIQENNKLFDRPIVYKGGEVLEKDIAVPANMDQMYLKLESVNNSVVSIVFIMSLFIVLFEPSLYKQLR